ncbi:MAG: malonyl-CoA decarboxylase domain-containing protein [Boseongicola sp.]
MVGTSYLGELLGTLLERPRILRRTKIEGSLAKLSDELLRERTEVASLQIASDILARFSALDADERTNYFLYMNNDLDVDPTKITKAADAYGKDPSPSLYRDLARATEPKRYELLRRLNQPLGATAELVRMRADLLGKVRENPDLARTDADFCLMLRAWFNRGFLVLRQITWDSPASILEKIIAYEAVHEIETWDDLRRRLHPADRRCFAFFHPAMPDEPLIFVEIALSKGIPTSIQDVLTDKREVLDEGSADTAVFYSISNCQKGLSGISFGNSLIKQVARDLSVELPGISNFVTLSPIPGLNHWLNDRGIEVDVADTTAIKKLAAYYLAREKENSGKPLDPVARFHLSNGAQIHTIQTNADLSEIGQTRSLGAMVNYAYELGKITENLRLFDEKGQVAATGSIRNLARQGAHIVGKK